jgi:drug/metabolite transporter (DMT)-like permease
LLRLILHSNTSSVFTLLFAWLSGVEKITVGKVAGIALCLLGVAIVSYQDEEGEKGQEHSLIGDVVGLIGALSYGLYTTILCAKVTIIAEVVYTFYDGDTMDRSQNANFQTKRDCLFFEIKS